MDERYLYAAGGVVVGVAAGIGATYMWFQKKFDEEVADAVRKERDAAKILYSNLSKENYPSPEDLAQERGLKIVDEIIEDEGYTGEAEAVEEELKEVSKNVFTNYANISTWDADAEEAKRDPDLPYIISHDEFFENQPEHEQAQLTYFAEDEVLADTEDKPVDESIVGPDNLEQFGHGSRDPNIVYVRNEKMDIDFEIVRAEGKYSEQVMGFIQHDDRPIRKFRLNDE